MKAYRPVPKHAVVDYTRVNNLSYSLDEYTDELVQQESQAQNVLINELDVFDKSFKELDFILDPEKKLEEVIDTVDTTLLFQANYWTPTKLVKHEPQISNLEEYELIKPFNFFISSHKLIETENNFEIIEPTSSSRDSTPDWIKNTIVISGFEESFDQHRDILESLFQIEKNKMSASKMSHNDGDDNESYTVELPLLTLELETNFSDIVHTKILTSEPTLADNDISDEMDSIDEKAQKFILKDLDLNLVLNETKKISHHDENISKMKLEYPVFPDSSTANMLQEIKIVDILTDHANSLRSTSNSDEEFNITNFADQNYWEEDLSESILLKLPLPIMELTAWETKIPPQLPVFNFPEWNISYNIICAMNWTPFYDMTPIHSEDLSELNEYFSFIKLIDEQYTVKNKNELYRSISRMVNNIADENAMIQVITEYNIANKPETPSTRILIQKKNSSQPEALKSDNVFELSQSNKIELTPTKSPQTLQRSRFVTDFELSSDEDEPNTAERQENEKIEVVGINSKNEILESSTSLVNFHDFTSAFENKALFSTPPEQKYSSPTFLYKQPTSDVDYQYLNDSKLKDYEETQNVREIQNSLPESFTSNEKISHLIREMDDENSDEDWSALDQIVKKKQKTLSLPQQTLIPPAQSMLQFSPFFGSKSKITEEETHSNHSSSSLFFESPTHSWSSINNSKGNSSSLRQTKTSDVFEEIALTNVKWAPPVLSSTSMACSRVVVNTSNTPLSIIRQFSTNLSSGIEIIEADLGNDKTANFYISHKACIVLLSLITLGQQSLDGKLKVLKKLKDVNLTTEMVFAIILVEKSQIISQKELDNLRIFQVSTTILPWLQSFVIPSTANESDSNLVNLVANLGSIHGIDFLEPDIFEGIPVRSLHFLRLCGINCIAAALILKDIGLVDFIKASPAYLAIKYGDLMSQSQLVCFIFIYFYFILVPYKCMISGWVLVNKFIGFFADNIYK